MSFVKKIWKDRISQFPNRRTINDGYVTKQVTVGRDEGAVTEEGTPFDATEMNDLENRIYAAIEEGGGGGGGAGTYDYTELFNKPRINNHELNGNKSLGDLGIASNANELPIESGSSTNTKDYIDSGLSGIGILIDGTTTGSVACANNTPTQVGTITLDKGNYMVIGCIDWQSNTNGERQACISTANTSAINPARQGATTINACSGTKEAYVQTMQFLEIANNNTTIYLFGWQNSGSSLNAYPYIRAMKVG